MFLAEKEFPLPVEYRFMPLQEVFHEPPADLADRTVVFLDCGNIDRMPVEWLRDGADILNIDHHHDNTRFGSINLVDDTRLLHRRDRLRARRRCSAPRSRRRSRRALYVGLITDTGMFMYENTGARTHRVAATLIDAGRRRQRDLPAPVRACPDREAAAARPGPRSRRAAPRRTPARRAYVSAEDYEATGADETLTEGIIDFVRALEGTAVAAVIRDKPNSGGAARKASLRSTDGAVDVSAIARKMGGGGHRARRRLLQRPPIRRADRLPLRLRRSCAAWLSRSCRPSPRPASCSSTSRPASPPTTWSPGSAASAAQGRGRSATPAPSTRSPPAARRPARRARPGCSATCSAAEDLRRPGPARLASTTGDPDGELTETGVVPGAARAADRGDPAAGAADLRRQGRRRARSTSAPTAARSDEVERPVREVEIVRRCGQLDAEPASWAEFEIECSSGTYVRTLIEELGDAYCETLRRTAVGHLRLEDAGETFAAACELVSHLPARSSMPPKPSDRRARTPPAGGRGVPEGEALRLMSRRSPARDRAPGRRQLVTEVVLA